MAACDADEPLDRFRNLYRLADRTVLDRIEREVIGVVYRANGYTTRTQVDDIARRLELGAKQRLLDIGAGCGWPGLYLAETTGCGIVMTDPVVEGLPVAMARAEADGLAQRASALAATGDALPFRSRSFDAAVHTDVLC